MDIKELTETGLTKNQAEIYVCLLKYPGKTAGEIAKKISLDRSFTYGILNSLKDKGLASFVEKENKRVFFASEPKNLLKEIDEKRSKTLQLISELESIKQETQGEYSVNVYEGKAGLKAYVRDFLETESFCTLGGGDTLNLFELLKYPYPQYLKELKNKKIVGQLITSGKNKAAMDKIYKTSEVKIKAFDNIKSPVSFTIFKNKVAIYSAEEKPFVIIIENKNVSEALKSYFDILWKK